MMTRELDLGVCRKTLTEFALWNRKIANTFTLIVESVIGQKKIPRLNDDFMDDVMGQVRTYENVLTKVSNKCGLDTREIRENLKNLREERWNVFQSNPHWFANEITNLDKTLWEITYTGWDNRR